MSSETIEQIARETRERVIRLESRMVQLGDHVGANLRSKQRIEIFRPLTKGAWVEVDSLDVSVSRILTELRQAGITSQPDVEVFHNGRLVFTVHINI